MNATMILAVLMPTTPAVDPDVIIRGATVYDGTGKPGVVVDIAVTGDRISEVGSAKAGPKTRIIQGSGLVVAPGFIDLHTHCDTGDPAITSEKGRMNANYLFQGVTTAVTGNCGSGPVDTADYYARLEKNGVGTNVAHQVPHNSVRTKAMGNANRGPTVEELKHMEELTEKAMKDGAWGLSTGLIYTPGTYSKTEELITLAKIAGRHGGIYASHIRNEGTGLLDAILEVLRIGTDAKLPVHVSHIKATGKNAWGKSADAIKVIEKARASGMKVTADQYPYIASSTSLAATVIPTRFRNGTAKEYLDRLADPESGSRIRAAVDSYMSERDGGANLQIARYKPNPKWQGMTVKAIAESVKKSATDIVLEIEKNGGAGVVNFGMNEEDVRMYMKQPWVATASDGSVQIGGDTVPHPRSYGTFPRKIAFYSRKEGLISLEHAIRSASGLPADILGLPERGYVRAGYFADLVVFDPKTYRETATFTQPHQLAEGVRFLFVNGKATIDDGKLQAKPSGRPLRHGSTAK